MTAGVAAKPGPGRGAEGRRFLLAYALGTLVVFSCFSGKRMPRTSTRRARVEE